MNTIAALRTRKELTQQELANKLGVAVSSVANWEQGKHDPPAKHLKKLARLFGTHAEDIDLPSDRAADVSIAS